VSATIQAIDEDAGDTITYSIVNTADTDFSKFNLTNAGVLTFISTPDHEKPTDIGELDGDNHYILEIKADDGQGGITSQQVEIIVINLPDAILGTTLADNPLNGSELGEVIKGLAGNDVIHAGDGADIIIGGSGKDSLFGEAGADIFDLNKIKESGVGIKLRDTIKDFEDGVDKIDLTTIDANTTISGNQKFKIIGENVAFTHKAGQLHMLTRMASSSWKATSTATATPISRSRSSAASPCSTTSSVS
jgi:serralysin